MSSDNDDDFYAKFENYKIPKKPKTAVEDKDVANEKDDSEEGEIKEPVKTPPPKESHSPFKKKRIPKRSFFDSPKDNFAVGSGDPLALERVMTYGEVRGSRHKALEIFLSQYEDTIPEEVKSKSTNAACGLCEIDFESQVSVAKSHYAGKNHAKKFKQALEAWHAKDPENNVMPTLKPAGAASENGAEGALSFFENRPDHDKTFCNICNLELTSEIVATSHYQGKSHAKQLRKIESGTYIPKEDLPGGKRRRTMPLDDKALFVDTEARQGSGNRFFCLTCKLHFKSQDQYNHHLSSLAHHNKANSNEIPTLSNTSDFKPSVPSNDSIDDMLSKLRANPNSAFDCSLCQVQCSSQGTLATHLAGKQHKRKLEIAQNNQNNSNFRCDICNVETTDQNGLDMHLAGRKHIKKASQQSM